MPWIVATSQLAYEPSLSLAQVSIACDAVVTCVLASASVPFCLWFRKDGIAIAARMPMIRITTRSSIRVNPLSSWARSRSFRNIYFLLLVGATPPVAIIGLGVLGSE